MSVQNALKFIQAIGNDPLLRKQLQLLGHQAELGDIVKMGAREGLEFTEEEFSTAFATDWKMRRHYYCGEKIM